MGPSNSLALLYTHFYSDWFQKYGKCGRV